jgi:hypothetical protein
MEISQGNALFSYIKLENWREDDVVPGGWLVSVGGGRRHGKAVEGCI